MGISGIPFSKAFGKIFDRLPTQRMQPPMKYAANRTYADREAAARKLVEIARGIEPVQDGRLYVELLNVPFLNLGASGEEFATGIKYAAERGWLELHESGTFVRLLVKKNEGLL